MILNCTPSTQNEYYATHQYFLSKRSLYLVMWKMTDGEKGIAEMEQWLINIQARNMIDHFIKKHLVRTAVSIKFAKMPNKIVGL